MGSNDQMLTWNTHSKTIMDGVKSVHITDKYTDVTLVAEGEFFQAHRVILGACSEYFEMLFSYADNPKPFIVLDQPSKFIRGLLDYIYEGEVQLPSEDMKQFFKVAQFLKVRGLYVSDDDDPLHLSHHLMPQIPIPTDENAKFQENLRLSLAHVDYLGSKYRPKGIAPHSAATTTTVSAIPSTVNFGVTNPFSLNVVTNQLFGGTSARGQINAYHLKPIVDGKRSPPLRKTPPPAKRKRTVHPTNESELASEHQQKAKNAKRSNPPSRMSPVNACPATTSAVLHTPGTIFNPNILSTTTSNPITTILLTTAIPTATTTSVLPHALLDKLESQGKLMSEKASGGQLRMGRATSPSSFLLASSSSTSSGAVCGEAGFADSTYSASREALNLMPQVKIEMDEDPDEQRQLNHVIDGADQMEVDLRAKTEPENSDNQRELLVYDDAAAGDEGGHEGRSCSSSSSQGTEGGGSSGDANGSSATRPSSPTLPLLVELRVSSPSPPTRDTLAAPSPLPLSLVVHCNNSTSASSPPEGVGVYSSCGSLAAADLPNTLSSCNTTPAAVADADTTVGRGQDPATGGCGRDPEAVGANGSSVTSTSCGDGCYAMDRNGHEDDKDDEYEVERRVVSATTASVPLAPIAATLGSGDVSNGDGGSLYMLPSSTACSVSPGLNPASAITGLPVACLPSALSSLASLGLGLCGATAGVEGGGGSSGPSPFGKISPVSGSGATGSRGGTPDIPHTNGGSNHCASTILNGNTKQNHCTTGQAAPASSFASSNANCLILNNNDNSSINNNNLKYVATMSPNKGVGDDKPHYTSTTGCTNSLPFNLSAALAAANLHHHQAGSQHSTTALTGGGPPSSHLSPTSQHNSTSSGSNSDRQTYLCPLCGKQFGQPYNLRRHMSTHTGDRPFQCPHCEYAASQNVHLDKHIRRIHLNNASENGGGSGSVPVGSPAPSPYCALNGHHLLRNGDSGHTNVAVGGGAVTLNGGSGSGISIKGNGIAMNAGGGGSNGILMVDPSARSPKTLVNTHWKFESTAVTP